MLTTTWASTYAGREIRVVRNYLTNGFEARIAGRKVGGRLFSIFRFASLERDVEVDGKSVRVEVRLPGGRECNVWIDGTWVRMVATLH
jgi:hypothetical protein